MADAVTLKAFQLAKAATISPNPLNPLIWKLVSGQSANLQIWGDSTTVDGDPGNGSTFGTTDRRWVGQWADQLVSSGRLDNIAPGAGLRIHRFLGGIYNDTSYLETIRTSTSGVWLDIWLAGVSGSIPHYFLGAYFLPSLGSVPADTLIVSHGINMVNLGGAASMASMYMAAVEQYRMAHPETAIGMFTQHPNRDTTAHDLIPQVLVPAASALGVAVNNKPYATFIAAGKPTAWYADDKHESVPLGTAPYVTAMNEWWDGGLAVQSSFRPSRFATPAGTTQLLANGDFATWSNTAAAPDGWTADGTIAFSKDTTTYADQRKPYSVRMVPSGAAQTRIRQTLTASMVQGRTITLAARVHKDTTNSVATLGRLQVSWSSAGSGSGNVTSPSFNTQQNGFSWWCISATLPSDATGVNASVFVDTSTAPNGTDGIRVDQASCVLGDKPLAFR